MYYSELFEYANLYDYRHENVENKRPFWGAKTSDYIDPKDGFYFMFSSGELMLFSTQNEVYSYYVSQNIVPQKGSTKSPPGPSWNSFGGLVRYATKTVTILKESTGNSYRVRSIYDIKELQNALRSLMKFGVASDFVLKGSHPPFNGKTVAAVLEMNSYVDDVLTNYHPIMYHGTSLKRWDAIQKEGLLPGKFEEAYNDLIPGYSEKNVYLAVNPNTAEFYGKRQAIKDEEREYVILKIVVPDASKLLPDDYFGHFITKENLLKKIKSSIKEAGSLGYKGTILPKFITIFKTKKRS